MKRLFLFLCLSGSLLMAQTPLNIGKISTALETEITQQPDDMLIISMLLSDRVDMVALETNLRAEKAALDKRTATTIHRLQQKAAETQGPLLAFLQQHQRVDHSSIQAFWINNVVFARVHPSVIPALSQRPDIEWIDKDYENELYAYEEAGKAPTLAPGGREPGLDAIRAPLLWKLGYFGKDRVVMSFDTGVDDGHPGLSDRFRANVVPPSWTWLDVQDSTNFIPSFCDSHGTHTVGTMVGMNPLTNDTTGVAPQAYWIGSSFCGQGGQAMNVAVFQWALDPDGDPTTTADMPDAINNSWGIPGLTDECSGYFVGLFQALETAGVAVIFAAGNDGPGVSTIGPPNNINHDTVDVFSVGNLSGNNPLYPISNSSSRGPSACGGTGTLLIKPEVSAPGSFVRSTVLNGNYSFFSGTSMAAPHVSGAILLLREAFPYLPSRDLKMALYRTARDLGPRGEDNSYGMGLIDVFTAYLELVADGNVPNTGTPPNLEVAVTSMLAPGDSLICETTVSPIIRLKNYGTDTVTTLRMASLFSNGLTDTLDWTGSWAPGTEIDLPLTPQVLAPSFYVLTTTVINVNGSQDFFDGNNSGRVEFVNLNEPVLVAINDTVCAGSDVLLESQTANPWELQWYTAPNGGFPIASGDQFTLPSLGQDTLLYIASGLATTSGLSDTIEASGSFHQQTNGTMFFTLNQPATLVSLDMVTETQGLRLIQLLKDVPNNVVQEVGAFQLDSGKQTLNVNMSIPAGSYKITIAGFSGVFRQNGAVTYPIDIEGLGSITAAEPVASAYYYFYNMKFVAENGCPRKPVSVTVQAAEATAAFSADNTNPVLPDSATVQFSDLSTNAQSWFWDFGDSTTSTDPSPQHAYTQPGTYGVSLTVTDAKGCSSTQVDSIRVTGFPVAITLAPQLDFKLYPNPGTQTLIVELADQSQPVQIAVWNTQGQRLITKLMPVQGKLSLDMSDYADGIYLVVIRDGDQRFMRKWVKQAN